MSKFFIENNQEGAKNLFNKKQMFKLVSQSSYKNLIDFNFGEKRLYARTNKYMQPIVPVETFFELVELKTGSPEPIKVFNFVADAFRDLQNKFKIKVVRNEISATEKHLTDLVPVAAYKDPKQIYEKYTNSFSIAVGNVIKDNNLKFTNFNEFINVLTPYLQSFMKEKVLTYPAYVKSRQCPMNINGLVIEIAEVDPNNDELKHKDFYKSKNWEFFLNACSAYGFMVDCNMPNKIIADINSPTMLERMANYAPAINSGEKFISYCYEHSAISYFADFKRLLYTVYSSNRPRTIVTTTNNSYDGTRSVIRKVKNYKFSEFVSEIGNEELFRLYMQIRFMEEESKFSHHEKKIITRDSIEMSKINGINDGILIFELLLNKTFDYSGSLSYIQKRRKDLRK